MPWDFALVLLFFATAVPIVGRRRMRQLMRTEKTTRADRLTLYASTAVFQWLSAALILWRTTARGIAPPSLGIAIPKPALTLTVTILLAALILANQLISLRRLALRPTEAQGILPQLAMKVFPQDFSERLAFFGLVVTVSICEELIYRGFAQRVFQSFSGGIGRRNHWFCAAFRNRPPLSGPPRTVVYASGGRLILLGARLDREPRRTYGRPLRR